MQKISGMADRLIQSTELFVQKTTPMNQFKPQVIKPIIILKRKPEDIVLVSSRIELKLLLKMVEVDPAILDAVT